MAGDLGLVGLVLLCAAVLIVLLVVVVRALNSGRRRKVSSLLRPEPVDRIPAASSSSLARGVGYLYGPMGSTRRRRSVGLNLERAAQRVDAVDPYAVPRRIGQALTEIGLSLAADTRPDRAVSTDPTTPSTTEPPR
jgi:hypothetical protein